MSRNMYAKRTYASFRQFASELFHLLRHARGALHALRRELSPAFRERLLLAVTSVNECRYCAWFHSRAALRSGVEAGEITALLGGEFGRAPETEHPALRYAIHWAERDAQPDPEVRGELFQIYGSARAEAIEISLRMIRMGNLMGNTWDAILSRPGIRKQRKALR
ncbi:MAG: carboxymuconolactone decarboxylase family protein [Candidatus Latescibacterota bacterium]